LKPSEVTQTSLIPTSIPIAFSIFGSSKMGSSTAKDTKYLFAQSLDIVTEVGSPSNFLDHRIFKGSLFLAIFKIPLEKLNADLTYRTDCFEFFFLNLGYLARPEKN
jgi:hypothetical protein